MTTLTLGRNGSASPPPKALSVRTQDALSCSIAGGE